MSIISNIIDSDLRGFKVNDEIVVDKNVIGEFIKNSAKLTILNKNHQYDSLEKTYLNITNFGKWYVDNLNNNEESVEADLTLFDLSIKFDEDYEDTFSFPATLGEWANWIGNKVGVPLKGTFLNSDKQLTEKPYLGNKPKYRTAVKIIAKYASGWAEINEDESYSIKWFDDTTTNIEDWESFKHGSTTDSVNIVILSTGVTEDNIRYPEQIPTNAHELRIEDDWLAIDRYLISKSIFEQVNGFSYTTITELTLPYGLLQFKVGQKIKAKDIELNEIESYISSHILTWNGGDWDDPNSWTSTLRMDELKETTTKYQYSNSIESRVGKTEINCDKNNKRINMLVEDVDEIEKDITTSKQAQGNPIEVEDAGEYNLESIGIKGKSYQETYSGKQLIDFSKAQRINTSSSFSFSNDTLNVEGTIGYSGCQVNILDYLKNNAGKTLYFNFESITGTRYGAPVQIFYVNSGVSNWKPIVNADLDKLSVKIPNDTSNITYAVIQFESNNTATVQNSNMTIVKPILSFNENAEYEEYTGGIPSPNPEYPQEIKTVQGITNEFDRELELGNYGASGEKITATNIYRNTNIIEVKPDTTYTFSINGFSQKYCLYFYDSSKTFLSNNLSLTTGTFTTPNNCYYINFRCFASDFVNDYSNLKIQLEKGTVAHRYVPYGRWLEQITTGHQMFNKNDVVIGYINADGTINSTDGNYRTSNFIPVEPNEKYYKGITMSSRVKFFDINGIPLNTTTYQDIPNGQNAVFFTTPVNAHYLRLTIRNNSADTYIDNLMINKGDVLLPYEEYKENTALIDMNKDNLFDKDENIISPYYYNETNGNISQTGTLGNYLQESYVEVEPNTIYTLSGIGTYLRIIEYNQDKSFIKGYTSGLNSKLSITTTANTKYIRVSFKDDPNNIKLYEGYDPYYEFAEVDNTKDEFLDGELTKRVEKIVLDGNENWVNDGRRYGTPDYNELMITPPNNATKAQALCSINIISATDTFEQKSGLAIHPNGSIYISNDVKTLLDNGDKIVLYIVLKEPKTYKLNYESLKLHKGYNYITLNDDLYPNMNIRYLTDSKLNAGFVTHAQFSIESDKIENSLRGKVSSDELNETITEVSNDFTQKIGESEASTESKITVATNNAINTSENYTNAQLANRPTKTEMTSAITQSANATEAKAEILVQQKIEDIQIGGTNLGRKGCISPYNSNGNTTVNNTNFDKNGSAVITRKAFMNEGPMLDRYVRYEVGQKYVISFEFKTSTSTVTSFNIHNGTNATNTEVYVDGILKGSFGQQIPFTPDGNYHKIELRFKAGNNQNPEVLDTNHIIFQPDKLNSRAYTGELRYFKIEKGDKRTDWSPAPEDKLDNSKFTKAEIIAEINNGVSNVKIFAENIQLANFVISGGKLTSLVTTKYNFTQSDVTKVRELIMEGSWTTAELNKYDINKNEKIDANDYISIKGIVDGNISTSKPGKFEINTNQDDYTHKGLIYGYDGDGVEKISIGLGESKLTNLNVHGTLTSNGDLNIAGSGTITGGIGTNGQVFANGTVFSNTLPVVNTNGTGNSLIKSIRMEYSPKSYLEILAEGGAYGIDAWASDKRLKRRVKDSKYNALDTLRKIKHRQFIYRNTNEKVLIGYVADELQELDPNMVFEVGPQKIKQPNPSVIIPILSKAIQEQQEIIDKQDKRIKELEDQVKKLLELVEREQNGSN